ncbi:AMP-binding protein [Neobittarella massiliensis]|uniref:AMP-binding protein n=1 Tax=Neobittarella massiliensis (ex Bilen et al. 2018) TaxID=2041842 RepID=A0A8J6IM90_9FIRM|nr:AMP-binding protein [Neobittarella massiliensis]MBC3516284.1 AMP-binding protein [Neobittarella massiliensis]
MRLSFSINGWQGYSWEEFVAVAGETGMQGIELRGIHQGELAGKHGPFGPHHAAATVRDLFEKQLSIPCLDSVCDISDIAGRADTVAEVTACMQAAKDLRVPYVRVHATSGGKSAVEAAGDCLKQLVTRAEELGVTLLLETVGIFSDTAALRDLLNRFASDHLAALWDLHHPYRDHGEQPEQTIQNLGAYVRHVHVKDSTVGEDGRPVYCLIGEGSLPMDQLMRALGSINYDGFISLEWDPQWMPGLQDMEVIFTHFVTYMEQFGSPSRAPHHLYDNTTHTGQFVWKKDDLIDLTFSQVLDRMVEEFPDQYAFKYTTLDYTRTYAQFRDDVDQFCRVLISLGVKAGSHVAIWATNIPQWFIAFWSVTKIGAVLVSMNTAYKIHEAEYLLRQSDTHTLIMVEGFRDAHYKSIVQELCPELATTRPGQPLHSRRLPFLRNVITVGCKVPGCLCWEEAMQRADNVPVEEVYRLAAKVDPGDVCNMQYTSGTTGFPKGVMLTHYNVVNNGKYIGDRMDLSTADRMMIQVPMFHCFGMVLSMTASMTHGTTMCPLPYFSPASALACVSAERITCFNGVPTMFIAMMGHPDFATTDFSYIRTGIMAGSNCPADLMRQAAEVMNMRQIVSVYGQTEASPGCTMSSFTDPLEVRTDTVGSAFANVSCKIIDPDTGADCQDGETGEFVARGYNIMKGYYKMPGATEAAIDAEGWLHTGDLACRDRDGNYRITGRLKDMIIRGGENIYPKEIEEFIFTHPKVQDVQVIGVPDKRYGEEIMACIILKEGQQMTAEEMRGYIADHMARHKVPRYIDFVAEFPMNVAGKILKYKMREDAVKKLGLGD